MRATIDKAGRVVIPAPIRTAALLLPGTELEVTVEGDAVRLRRVVSGPKLVKDGGGWIARPTVPVERLPEVDFASLVLLRHDIRVLSAAEAVLELDSASGS